MLRDSEIALAVGTESMSQAPFVVRGARFGVKFSQTPEVFILKITVDLLYNCVCSVK